MARHITHFKTKVCSKCTDAYVHRSNWYMPVCPNCAIDIIEYATDYKWYPYSDTLEHINYGDESTFCVVEIQDGYKIFTRAAIKRRGNRVPDVVHVGTLKSCVEYIKRMS